MLDTVCGFRDPLRVLKYTPVDKGVLLYVDGKYKKIIFR
jgi:hypothetical protein